ncbi:MAG: hypothetical protein HY286_03575 [Planctomycetes bacterium]|nr:hypothetical protein [Planctomycetota bacterium]
MNQIGWGALRMGERGGSCKENEYYGDSLEGGLDAHGCRKCWKLIEGSSAGKRAKIHESRRLSQNLQGVAGVQEQMDRERRFPLRSDFAGLRKTRESA